MNRPCRLLVVINSLEGGGAEKNVGILLRHLNRSRFRPELLLLHEHIDQPDLVPRDIPVRSLHGPRPTRFVHRSFLLSRKLRRHPPDLILAFLEYGHLLALSTTLLLGPRIPVVLSVRADLDRNLAMIRKMRGSVPGRALEVLIRTLYPHAARIHVQTERSGQALLRVCPRVAPQRLAVIPNAVDVDAIRRSSEGPAPTLPNPSRPMVLFVGRLTWQKNIDLLLRAFSRIQDADLMIVGKGDQEPFLRAEAKRLGISDRTHFLGFERNPLPLYRAARLLVLPSRFEGFPVVLTEAMACGLPVVATDCPTGPREIVVDGETGILVPPESEDGLASAMRKLLEAPDLARRMGDNGFERVRQWDVARIVPQFEDLLLRSAP